MKKYLVGGAVRDMILGKEPHDKDYVDITVKNEIYNLCGENWLTTLETVNGYHIIAKKKFRTDNLVLPKEVTIKDNALTLVYTS